MHSAIEQVSTNWLAVCLLAVLLGLRHGFDADHLTAVDGLTRLHASRKTGVARWTGLLFSLGHGAVVTAIALTIGLLDPRLHVPTWLDALGTAVSVGFLLVLGLANLRALVLAQPGVVLAPVGIKGRLLGGLIQARGRWGVVAVGALFALSFDVVSQSALFALAASHFGTAWHAGLLGLLFMTGMVVTDGLNGLWICRLMARADRMAAIASRVMGGAVAALSFAVAGLGIARMTSAGFDHWREDRELLLGCAVIVAMTASYLAAAALGNKPLSAMALRKLALQREAPCNGSRFRWMRRWRRSSTCGLPSAATTTAARRCATCCAPSCSRRG